MNHLNFIINENIWKCAEYFVVALSVFGFEMGSKSLTGLLSTRQLPGALTANC